MTPEELCQKLRPILGEKIDQLWKAYVIEDSSGKREIERILQILYHKNFPAGFNQEKDSTLTPPSEDKIRGEYPLGMVTYAYKELFPFGLREKDWIKHVLIVGASGSGKTNLCFQVIKNFINKKKPFLVFDWKRNYRDIITEEYGSEVRVYTVGRKAAPFKFNPLIPPPGTAAKNWLKKLIEIIAHATFVGEGVMYLLQKGLDQTYEEFGLYGTEPVTKYPTLKDLLKVINSMQAKGREAGWMASTLRALGALTFGESGEIFNITQQSDMKEMLDNQVILEMDSLTNSDKTFLVESILLWIHHYRLSSPNNQREQFDHAIILEEAHHIIGKAKSDLIGGEAITDVIIREIRELGESVIIIDQCPSLLSLPARANTWTTIALNLKDAKDVNSAASAMLLEAADKKIIGRLEVGEAVVKLQGRWHSPFSIKIPHVAITKGSVTDLMIKNRMIPYSTIPLSETSEYVKEKVFPEIPEPRKKEEKIKPQELELLNDIQNNKLSGVVERYKRLGWSRRKGNENKKSLLIKNLIGTEEIPTNSGRIVILKITNEGKEMVKTILPEPNRELREGGVTHEYWKNKYAEEYQNKGYKTELEAPVGNGKTIDLVASKDNQKTAIEIETGRSDILSNINKCLQANINRIIIVATNDQAEMKIFRILRDHCLLNNDQILVENVNKKRKVINSSTNHSPPIILPPAAPPDKKVQEDTFPRYGVQYQTTVEKFSTPHV